jgi:hypothetical protein
LPDKHPFKNLPGRGQGAGSRDWHRGGRPRSGQGGRRQTSCLDDQRGDQASALGGPRLSRTIARGRISVAIEVAPGQGRGAAVFMWGILELMFPDERSGKRPRCTARPTLRKRSVSG